MNNTVHSMTEGPTGKLLLQFTMPMLIGNLFQQFYNMVDAIIVGKFVDANALGAVGATGAINFLFFSLSFGMAAGVGIVVSQYFGAKDDIQVQKSIANGIYLLLGSAAFTGAIGLIFAPQIMRMLNTPAIIFQDSVVYMRMICAGIISVAAYNGVSAILRSFGDSKTPLIFLIISSFVNVGLDLLFVIVFEWSVFGVGLATVIAQTVAAVGCILYAYRKISYFRIPKSYLRPEWMVMKKSITIGLPIAFQNSMIAISCIALQRVVNDFGESVVAASTAVSRIEQLVQQPFTSLGTALSAYTGQNMGAGKIDRVKKGFWVSTLYVGIFSVIMLVVMQLFGGSIVGWFVDEQEVIEIGNTALKITSWFYFSLGMIYVTRSVMNGAGDAAYAMLNGVMEVIGRIGFARPLTMIPSIGLWGVFLTNGLTWFITAAASWIRYGRGKWKSKAIINTCDTKKPPHKS